MNLKASLTCTLVPQMNQGPFVFRNHDLKTACQLTKKHGFQGIELFFTNPSDINIQEVKKLLNSEGLLCSALGSGAGWVVHRLSLTSENRDIRKNAVNYIRELVGIAAELQTSVIIGSMQGNSSSAVDRSTALKYLAEGLAELAQIPETAQYPILYEPLNRYETNLINTLGAGVELLQTLPPQRVKLLADLFHLNIEEKNISQSIQAAYPWIGHIHFADSNRQAVTEGHLDIPPIAEVLLQNKFTGFLAAEIFPDTDPELSAAKTMKALKLYFPSAFGS